MIGISQCECLKELMFSSNLNPAGLRHFISLLRSTKTLEALHLEELENGDGTTESDPEKNNAEIWHAIGELLGKNASLSELHYLACSSGCAEFLSALETNSVLTSLIIACNIDDCMYIGPRIGAVLKSVLSKNKGLRSLTFEGCQIDNGAAELISQGLQQNTTLECLDVSQSSVRPQVRDLLSALELNKTLRLLKIGVSEATSSERKALSLELARNQWYGRVQVPWCDMDVEGLVASLLDPLHCPTELHLYTELLSEPSFSAVCNALASDTCVKDLTVYFGSDTSVCVASLLQMLQENTSLRSLTFYDSFDEPGLSVLASQGLIVNEFVTDLTIVCYNMSTMSAELLGLLLLTNESLHKLVLSCHSGLEPGCLDAISDGLIQNHFITKRQATVTYFRLAFFPAKFATAAVYVVYIELVRVQVLACRVHWWSLVLLCTMSEAVSPLVLSDIQAACSTLGGWDEGKYYKEPDCIESLKDLLRYLRRDDEAHEIRRILGRIQVLKTDLLPLLKFYPDDDTLFDVIVRLLVDLTNPAIILYKEELPVEKFARNIYLEIVSHLQAYKLAFTDSKVWITITKKLESLLHKNWETRQEEDKDMIERILVLIRNVLHVPANPSEEKRTDDDVSVHDQVLWAMHLAHVEDLLLYVTSSDDESDYAFHCLEILSQMLREQSPEVLARAEQPRSALEKEEDVRELLRAREVELAKKKVQMQARANRHPRFGGTFTVKNMKGIGDNNLIAHDSLSKLSQLSFDRSKPFKAKPKNRRPVLEPEDTTRRSTLNIRLFLKGLCTDFLKWCYNPLMRTVKSFLQRKKALSHDESYYFWALKFFMEFNRHNGFDVSLVSETISKESFHYVQTELEQYYEMMVTDKRKIQIWSKRLHVGLKAYQELLRTLAAMDSSPDEAVREAAKVLKGTIFYLPEYREIVLHLLLNFNEYVQPISYLRDLVEMVHVYIKMLQHFAKGHRHIIVKQKGKAHRQPKKQKPRENSQGNAVSEEVLQQHWLEVSCGIAVAIQGEEELPSDVVPYDSTLDNTEDEQKLDAVSRIRTALWARETAKAVSLLRAAQEVWPGHDMFGCQEDETEFQALKDIFFADMKGESVHEVWVACYRRG
ncbi:hypothetical protein V5799_011567 [Amblyomma americanum]|uniref:Timeless N-terminal domain-containing protein n=1 Tax=Amblyomma americanum TaxID=6943 RepID=A0AAQ4EGT9_AMBAM